MEGSKMVQATSNRLPEIEGGFASELRFSATVVIGFLAISAFVIFALSNIPFGMKERLRLVLFSIEVALLAGAAWALYRWRPGVGAWAAVIALLLEGWAAGRWVGYEGGLALTILPVLVAAALISVSAAVGIAALQTLVVVGARLWVDVPHVPGLTAAVILALWLAVGVMGMVYTPVYRVAGWAWEYYQHAQTLLEEARDRREELEQALEDLADANQQLTRLNLLAQGLRQAAEDARVAKEQFVANVSHELRTPLNMITGFTEMILQSPEMYGSRIPPALLADLAVIQRNGEHLAALINDVLDLSQVEAEQMALTREQTAFGEIVAAAVTAVRPLFESKGLYLETEVEPDLPALFCDPTRIREVLLNLLSNAGRFTERGGVRLWARRAQNDLLVSVADTGLGIADKDLTKLFQPFQQVDGSIRRRFGGTGLGLSISKRFIELHGGTIWVESQPGVGTTFTFRIPLLTMPQSSSGDFSRWLKPEWEFYQRTRPLAITQQEIHPRYVVVERDDTLSRLLTRYLDGVKIVQVADLDAALREATEVPTQMLLINSASVSRSLDQIRMGTALPSGVAIVICSVPGIREAADGMGVAERLIKPISREALLQALDRLKIDQGTVLIVDDEPDALQLFGRMLASSGRGYRVLLARDGIEALHVLEECQPDVILLDLVMPTMDGFALLEARTGDARLQKIPVIITSARDPAGQPVVSNALAVTTSQGLSARQLLLSIAALGQLLAPPNQVGGRVRPEMPPDSQVS